MLQGDEVEEAVGIQRRAYRLLRWVSDAVTRRAVSFGRAHTFASEAEAAEEWLAAHYDRFPADCRPAEASGPRLARFARYFASYLHTSFELVADPGKRFETSSGCTCEVCRYLVAAPHLRAKRVTRTDKTTAERIKRAYLAALAGELEIALDAGALERLLVEPDDAERAALACYGVELLRRCNGEPAGPEVLALWRQFAWLPTGSPKPDFELRAADILAAEAGLVERLRGLAR